MKKLVYGLLIGMTVCGSLAARTYTNKTFLMPRSHNENLAMEYTGWHKQVRDIDEDKWGGTFQATGFYEASTNKIGLGKYFGKLNEATGPNAENPYAGMIQDFIWVKTRATGNTNALLLDPSLMIHDYAVSIVPANRLNLKAFMRPKRTSYGVRFDWHQKLDKVTKGLFMKVTVPVVHIKHDMNMCYSGEKLTQAVPGDATKTVGLSDYLSGAFENTTAGNKQERLCKAKICSPQSITEVADVDVTLGYNFLYKEHKHVGANVCLTIPTSSKPDGEWLFEPIAGFAGHWAFGMGIDCAFELWQSGNMSLEFVGALNYKYVLDATEKRTVGFKYGDLIDDTYNTAGKRVSLGHYMLGGKNGKKELFPLANVLTRNVGVHPGSLVEVLAELAYNWKNLTIDLGYNLFAKEAESVMVKCWPDNTYGISLFNYNSDATATTVFAVANVFDGSYSTNRWIQKEDLLPCDAATPSYVTHKIFGGVTYAWHGWDYPLMVGIGGSWEFTQESNSAIDGYALWGKLGITF